VNSRSEEQAEILAGLSEFRTAETIDVPSVKCEQIVSALGQFMECVRYLNTRRSKGAKLNLESEADVQDALYLMLRPWVLDLVNENPTDKIGNRFSIKDFISKEARTVIEAKYVRDAAHGKSIAKELHDDIETYRHHPSCDHLVFFVYDPDSLIPNVAALQAEMNTKRVYDGKPLVCHLIVCP
jgi:hypothetical protein